MPELLWTLTVFALMACGAAYAADRVPERWVEWCAEVLR